MIKQAPYFEVGKSSQLKQSVVQASLAAEEVERREIWDFELGPNVGKGNFGLIYLAFNKSEAHQDKSVK